MVRCLCLGAGPAIPVCEPHSFSSQEGCYYLGKIGRDGPTYYSDSTHVFVDMLHLTFVGNGLTVC